MIDVAAGIIVSVLDHFRLVAYSPSVAMVRHVAGNAPGTEESKPAAAMAEAGPLRDMLNSHWTNSDSNHGPVIQKVHLDIRAMTTTLTCS